MPLPRFERLAPSSRAAILAVARTHFARDGRDASFNQIIADAGISKTSAYHYFDGKDDLLAAVAADATRRTLSALGPWTEVTTEEALWDQVLQGTHRLVSHLRDHPDDRAVLALASPPGTSPWVEHLVDNGLRLGVIDPHPDVELITLATVAVIGAADTWALNRPDVRDDAIPSALGVLLRRLWNSSRPFPGLA